jgi:hypothetical protein
MSRSRQPNYGRPLPTGDFVEQWSRFGPRRRRVTPLLTANIAGLRTPTSCKRFSFLLVLVCLALGFLGLVVVLKMNRTANLHHLPPKKDGVQSRFCSPAKPTTVARLNFSHTTKFLTALSIMFSRPLVCWLGQPAVLPDKNLYHLKAIRP